jgi:hypothetical protein
MASGSKGTIFAVEEESNSGATSYCWVERRKHGYYMFGLEFGEMSGPCETVYDAVSSADRQFGNMDYMDIETTLSAEEVRHILRGSNFPMTNVGHFTLNGVEVDDTAGFIASNDGINVT